MNNVDKNYYDNYFNVNDITNINNEEKIQDDLTTVNEGFRRGNIFKNIYWPYKKNIYNFKPSNQRQKLLLEIMENSFYIHELNLYLDNFPSDKKRIELFNKYNKQNNKLINEYSEKYEPLTLNGNGLNEIPWSWEDSPWPWEGV